VYKRQPKTPSRSFENLNSNYNKIWLTTRIAEL
jgi:hypothetical protein